MGNGLVSRSIHPNEQNYQGIAGFSGSGYFLQTEKIKTENFNITQNQVTPKEGLILI